jgi:NCS1 family nucleobase:cation symporter-1
MADLIQHELTPAEIARIREHPSYNEDIAPTSRAQRTWNVWHIAALWVGMAVCIPTYSLASGMIGAGMAWWQALLTVFLGNVIVLIPMTLNAHPGTAYGIPFPVLLRASFGIRGANVAALLRGVVACGWFGIQTWIGGAAIHSTLAMVIGMDGTPDPIAGLGISLSQLGCFLAFWLINVWFVSSCRNLDQLARGNGAVDKKAITTRHK